MEQEGVSLIERIRQLEKLARQLEPGAGKRDEVRRRVIDYCEHFLNHLDRIPAFVRGSSAITDFPIGEEPLNVDLALRLLRQHIDQPGLNPASAGHLGYIPGGGLYYSALGDYLADVFNRYAGVHFTGPGAAALEQHLVRWMADLFGYPGEAAGTLTSGGSVSNLMAVMVARDAAGLKSRDVDRAVIYMTHQAHHSIDKALRLAGLREAIIRRVPMDERWRMKADDLDRLIIMDKTNRLLPLMVVASAGTTDTGAVDPLADLARICRKHELWFHVDAAYGGFYILTQEGKNLLAGIEQSDSITVDPHKGLFLPYGTGALLVRRGELLKRSFSSQAAYLQDATAGESPADYSIELTRPFRGLRLWLPLMLHGLKPFRACLEEKLLLARYFEQQVRQLGFETGGPPQLSVVVYRYAGKGLDANSFNQRLVHAVHEDGRVFVSSTRINQQIYLRAAILSFRTHIKTIDLLLQVLEEQKQKVLAALAAVTQS
ncbi:MAG: aminotransferase class V-fold PLP-dependent enzyme [Chitinophagales bacterium]|nr:aminotransferase class V-fold PLP-dependent enzyme [Chitinophagales bacterium]MDW8428143.1 aminotransferase class V-fold PLP-dependent enzyme [Chitinophagales bacterium]